MNPDDLDHVESMANLPPLIPLAIAFFGGMPMLPAACSALTVFALMRALTMIRGSWFLLLPAVQDSETDKE